MFENVQVAKGDNKIVFSTDNFNDAQRLADILAFKGKTDTLINVHGKTFKVKTIKDRTITLMIEGEFEEFTDSSELVGTRKGGNENE